MSRIKKRILVVDDDRNIRLTLLALLQHHDYEVPEAVSSGEEAIAVAETIRPDLVIMDVVLHGPMDGIEAGKAIYARFDIPVIYLTGQCDEKTIDRAKISDPFGYLVKPFEERELFVAIEMALLRHDAETLMAERERWFKATLNCIGDGVIATDVQGCVTFLNPRAESLTNWESKDAVGRKLKQVAPLVEEHTRTEVELPELENLSPSHAAIPSEAILTARGGKECLVSYQLSVIRDERSQVDGMVMAFDDISARREMERRMLAKEKMEAIGKMASSISHEFNSVLALVAGHASSLTEHLIPNTRAYENTQRILEAIQHAGTLTKRILGIARATTTTDIHIEPMPLGDAVNQTVALVAKPFAERGITFEIDGATEMPVVMADPEQFLDLLMDLFMNGADAMPEGGVITIDAARKTIAKPDLTLNPHAKHGRYGVLNIRDSGKGLPRDMLDHIFEPFFFARERGMRSGLGLSVVQSAIQRYGGWIKVTSKPWGGNTFSLFIPEFPKAQLRAGKRKTSGARILVVDDREKSLAELEAILVGANYQVLKAAGGEEAIGIIQKQMDEIDLAIIDVIMPGKDGRSVLQALLELDPTATVIMTCGFSRDYVRSFLPPGAWKFIQKPFERDQLLSLVDRSLAQRVT